MAYAGLFTLDSNGNFNSQTDAFLELEPIKNNRDRIKKIVSSESKGDSNSKGTKCN